MITKTEVLSAIAEAEPKAGWSALDASATTVSSGTLHVLVEAAKRATYVDMGHNISARSNSDLWLTGS